MDCLLAAAAFRPGTYLAFRLAGQEFAIEARCVRGILPVHEMDALSEPSDWPPEWAQGVATLGGQDFPVVDLRRKLHLPRPARGRDPMIVVLEGGASERFRLVGFVADRVSGIVKAREYDYRRGKLRASGRPRRVLDVDAIASFDSVDRTPAGQTDVDRIMNTVSS